MNTKMWLKVNHHIVRMSKGNIVIISLLYDDFDV